LNEKTRTNVNKRKRKVRDLRSLEGKIGRWDEKFYTACVCDVRGGRDNKYRME
jgi:hypothetical protein